METEAVAARATRVENILRRIPRVKRPAFLNPVFELAPPLENPLFMRSLRSKMRGGRFYSFMVAYVILMVVVLVVTALSQWEQSMVFANTAQAQSMGQTTFIALVVTQA